MFYKNVLEAMLARLRSKSDAGIFLACFGMLRFGPTLEETLCMFDKNVLEAMLARLRSKSDAGMFWHVSLWPNIGKRPCACLIKHVLEAMLARLRSKSNAGMFWHACALAQRGKRPCACLEKMCWKRCCTFTF